MRSLHSLALRNLLARRLRTALTGVAIMLGIAAVGASPWFGTLVSRADADRYFGVMPPLGYMVTARPGANRAMIWSRLQAGLPIIEAIHHEAAALRHK